MFITSHISNECLLHGIYLSIAYSHYQHIKIILRGFVTGSMKIFDKNKYLIFEWSFQTYFSRNSLTLSSRLYSAEHDWLEAASKYGRAAAGHCLRSRCSLSWAVHLI
jgi:hypothetical protein